VDTVQAVEEFSVSVAAAQVNADRRMTGAGAVTVTVPAEAVTGSGFPSGLATTKPVSCTEIAEAGVFGATCIVSNPTDPLPMEVWLSP
jgi:hypothetical protein